jgi:polyhydroxybutyrate depolymerase
MKPLLCLVALLAFSTAHAALLRQQWTIGGVKREALVSVPANVSPGAPLPLVFAFHGHGGTMLQASRSFPIHEDWPGAIVVYPQGLPTPSALVDPEGLYPGWQGKPGEQGDRDLKFFDAMLVTFRAQYRIDDRRIYSMGHSNGGLFTYLLWAERGTVLAAVAPSSAILTGGFADLRPKPVLHIGSPEDPLVKFTWQEAMLSFVLKLNGCGPLNPDAMGYTSYASSKGAEVATYFHSGGHQYPQEATPLIVAFFQAHSLP